MEVIEKVTINHFIWYLLPGLVCLLLILFPLAVINITVAIKFYELLGIFGIILLGIVLGFIVEGLRLYRFRPNYGSIKNEFITNIQQILDSDLNSYYLLSRVKDHASNKKITIFEHKHSIWIMLGQLTILFFLEFVFWSIYLVYISCWNAQDTYQIFSTNLPEYQTLIVLIFFIVLFAFCAIRFYLISIEEQDTTNKMLVSFTKENVVSIKASL